MTDGPAPRPDPAVPAVDELTARLRAAAAQRLEHVRTESGREAEQQGLDDLTALNNELASLQRELAARNAELKALNEWKVRFLAMVAHDLRGPLTAIRGFAELLGVTLAGKMDEGDEDMLEQIVGAADRLRRMIEELMDASALESGKFRLRFEQGVVVGDLLKTALSQHEAAASYKGIELDATIAPDCPGLAKADPNKLIQVMSNLISNAIKYSHRGSRVRVGMRPEGDLLVFEVVDEGQGMSPEDLEKLFRPYGTTSVLATAGETSTGLGLVIVQAIVQGHGGTIEVSSTVDVGTTFRVELPVEGPGDDEGAAEASSASSD